MKNLIIAVIVALLAWFAWSSLKEGKKSDNAIVKYGEGLKSSEEKAKEAAATADLAIIRSAIIQFKGSQGRYPDSLEELKTKGYIDRVPEGVSYDGGTGEVK
jgi:predicted negative regulator of RcsB-dependent stress response